MRKQAERAYDLPKAQRVRRKIGIEFQSPSFHSIALSSISSCQRGGKTTRHLSSETAPPSVPFFYIAEGLQNICSPWKQRLSFWWLLCKESPCEALVGDSSIHTLNHATGIMRVKMGWHICIWVPGILPSGQKKISNLKNFFWHFIITYLTHPKIYKESHNE